MEPTVLRRSGNSWEQGTPGCYLGAWTLETFEATRVAAETVGKE